MVMVMTVKTNRSKLNLNGFPDFTDYPCPYLDFLKWRKLTEAEKLEVYHRNKTLHLKRQERILRLFMKEVK